MNIAIFFMFSPLIDVTYSNYWTRKDSQETIDKSGRKKEFSCTGPRMRNDY